MYENNRTLPDGAIRIRFSVSIPNHRTGRNFESGQFRKYENSPELSESCENEDDGARTRNLRRDRPVL